MMTLFFLLKHKVKRWISLAAFWQDRCLRNTADFPSKDIEVAAVWKLVIYQDICKNRKSLWAFDQNKTDGRHPGKRVKLELISDSTPTSKCFLWSEYRLHISVFMPHIFLFMAIYTVKLIHMIYKCHDFESNQRNKCSFS